MPWASARQFPRRKRALMVCTLGILLGMALPLLQLPLRARTAPISDGIADKNLDLQVEKILQRMTLEEKVGQLVQYSAGQPTA
jgi:hypothetical protein